MYVLFYGTVIIIGYFGQINVYKQMINIESNNNCQIAIIETIQLYRNKRNKSGQTNSFKNEVTEKRISYINCICIQMCANKWLMLNCYS